MNVTSEVAAYLCRHYPHKQELSKTRLTKLVYLCDWEAVKKGGEQITPIQWVFYKFGPYVDDVYSTVRADPRFKISDTENFYGDRKSVISLSGAAYRERLSDEDRATISSVIDRTKAMYWDAFIKHIYETPPIAYSNRYEALDLKKFVKLNES